MDYARLVNDVVAEPTAKELMKELNELFYPVADVQVYDGKAEGSTGGTETAEPKSKEKNIVKRTQQKSPRAPRAKKPKPEPKSSAAEIVILEDVVISGPEMVRVDEPSWDDGLSEEEKTIVLGVKKIKKRLVDSVRDCEANYRAVEAKVQALRLELRQAEEELKMHGQQLTISNRRIKKLNVYLGDVV